MPSPLCRQVATFAPPAYELIQAVTGNMEPVSAFNRLPALLSDYYAELEAHSPPGALDDYSYEVCDRNGVARACSHPVPH